MITVDDVRRITSTLPRSYEVVVRDQIKFRVGQIVYVAFSRDETVMGVAFPKEERAAMVEAEPDKFMLPRAIGHAIQLDSRPTGRDRPRGTARAGDRRVAHVCAQEGFGIGQLIGYSSFDSPTQRRSPVTVPLDLGRLACDPRRPAQLVGHDSSGHGDVRRPLAGQRVGHRSGLLCGRHSRCTSACTSSSSVVGTSSRASTALVLPNTTGAPIRHGIGNRATSGRSSVSTSGSIHSATVSVACGRLAGA